MTNLFEWLRVEKNQAQARNAKMKSEMGQSVPTESFIKNQYNVDKRPSNKLDKTLLSRCTNRRCGEMPENMT